ncbi:MAG TPA: cytochrome-c peroxidase, partial [Acidiferrobacterales bacterium]|nr:cytochrome-c peroxidase [Acidiferrobacterales bacterium]
MKHILLCLGLVITAPVTALATDALTPEQALGKMLYEDVNLSLNRNQSCATCHSLAATPGTLPTPGFADPVNITDGTAVSAGSVAGRFGALNSPSAGYAAFSPFFHWDATEKHYVGGQFWNGRAATLAEQARQPILNPLEMAMPSAWAVVTRLKQNPEYVNRFATVYGLDLKP